MNKKILLLILAALFTLIFFYIIVSLKCQPISMRIYKTNGEEVTNKLYPCGEISRFLEKILPVKLAN